MGKTKGLSADTQRKSCRRCGRRKEKPVSALWKKNGKEKGGRAAYKNITPVKGRKRIKTGGTQRKIKQNVEISFPQAVEKTVEKT